MDTVIRYRIVILVLLHLPLTLDAHEEILPLREGEGYLVVGIDISNIFWTSFSIEGGGRLSTAHRFKTEDLQTEPIYKIVRLPAGNYHWDRMKLLNRSWFAFGKTEYPMTVEAGRINYGGLFVGKGGSNERASFKVMNRASTAISYLETCCQDLLEKHSLRSGLTDADPFLEYYASLKHSEGIPAGSQKNSKAETAKSGVEALLARDFFRRNKYSAPQLSPNGQLVVMFEEIDNNRHIVLLDPAREHKYIVIREGSEADAKALELMDVDWIDNDDLLISYKVWDVERMAHAKIHLEDGLPNGVELKVLGDSWYVVDPLLEKEDKAAVVIYKDGQPNLYTIDINLQRSQTVVPRDRKLQNKIKSTFSWLLNRSGRVRAAVGVDDKKLTKTLWYRTSKSNKWYAIWIGDPEVTIVPVFASDDDRTLTVITNEHTENTVLTTYDRKSKTYGETIFQVEGSDIEAVMLNAAKTQIVLVTTTMDGIIRYHYMGEAKTRFPQLLDFDTFGSEPYIIDQSNDGKRAIVQTSTSDDPGVFYLLDVDKQLAYEFGELRPWLSKFRLGSSRIVTTKSSDGLELQSFLTMPDIDTYPKPPLIVMPHGGPISVQDRQHFNGTVQMFATLGYAVLQTNYRGSGGYGKSFEEKGERQWGRLIEDDIEAALDAVLDLGITDADRVCIYGASYGGYSALISAIRSPNRYKCAASFAGVTDMALLFHSFEVNNSNLIRATIERIVGDPERELDSMVRYSPVFNADKIEVPILIVHGEQDGTVDLEHYQRMLMMLNHFGKDVEYYSLPSEGHGFKFLSSTMTFYSTLDKFFRKAMDLPEPSVTKMVHKGMVWPTTGADELVPDSPMPE